MKCWMYVIFSVFGTERNYNSLCYFLFDIFFIIHFFSYNTSCLCAKKRDIASRKDVYEWIVRKIINSFEFFLMRFDEFKYKTKTKDHWKLFSKTKAGIIPDIRTSIENELRSLSAWIGSESWAPKDLKAFCKKKRAI